MFNVYKSGTINAITVVLIILWSQEHNFQSTVKNSDDEDFITNFNQTHEFNTYHLLTDCITEIYEGNKQAKDLIHTFNTDAFKFECFNLGNLHVNQDQTYTNELKQFFIPDHKDLCTWIIEFCHFNWVHNYEEEWAIFYQLDQHYWWPIILTDVKHFIDNCNDCNWYKTSHQWKPSFLMPLPVSEKRFKHLTIDFVTGLPSFINTHRKVCTNVIIIMNHFSKYTTFVFMWKIDAVSVDCIWLTEFYWENNALDFIILNCNL